jgi:hypothetical protein
MTARLRAALLLAISAVPLAAQGRILPASSGTTLKFCAVPGLSFTVRLDSAIAPGTPTAMGTSTLAASATNRGLHNDADEVVYFMNSGGRAYVGTDTVNAERGLVFFIPRGVAHGFMSPADHAMEFLWIIYPQGSSKPFRQNGIAPTAPCPGETR